MTPEMYALILTAGFFALVVLVVVEGSTPRKYPNDSSSLEARRRAHAALSRAEAASVAGDSTGVASAPISQSGNRMGHDASGTIRQRVTVPGCDLYDWSDYE